MPASSDASRGLSRSRRRQTVGMASSPSVRMTVPMNGLVRNEAERGLDEAGVALQRAGIEVHRREVVAAAVGALEPDR